MLLDEGQRLWDEHLSAPFPAGLRGQEIEGIDLVMLDADIAGCVSTWLGNKGRLDEPRRRWLEGSLDDLARILPLLADRDERVYYERLRQLAQLALT